MRHLNKIAYIFSAAALGMMALTSCEGGDLYSMDSPDWIKQKIDSISKSKDAGQEEVLVGMQEDVYTIGKTDYTSGWWSDWSKYYVIPQGAKWNAQFNLNINPDDNTYYKNFALVLTNDVDRGGAGYKEYGAIRFDATGDSAKFNSQWGDHLFFKFAESSLLLDPQDNKDANVQKLGGKVTLTVDRSEEGKFFIKMRNSAVTKTYTQPYELPNLNEDASNTNIRCFLVPEGSYIDFLSTNIEPIGGLTSAADKAPVSMVLNNVPDEVPLGSKLEDAMANVSAEVTYEQGVKKVVPAAELMFTAIPDMDQQGEKTLVVIYNKTFKGANATTPIVAQKKFKVVQAISSIEVTAQPTRAHYYYYNSEVTKDLADRTLAFDPTGLEVTATYVNGVKDVLNNSKLSFSAIPAAAGTHAVTITTENGKTAKVKVTVSESKVTAATPTPLTLGATDFSTAWSSQVYADNIKIPAGETRKVTFTNYSNLQGNWNNFLVVLRNDANVNYAVVRADNWGWDPGYDACLRAGTQGDWATWLAGMNGAKVTVYVTNCNNGTADVQAVMDGTNGVTSTQYYLGLNKIEPNDLNLSFSVDGSYLVFDNGAAARKFHAHRR